MFTARWLTFGVIGAACLLATYGCARSHRFRQDTGVREECAPWLGLLGEVAGPEDIAFVDVMADEWTGEASGVVHIVTRGGEVRRYSATFDGRAAKLELFELASTEHTFVDLARSIAADLPSHQPADREHSLIQSLSRPIHRMVLARDGTAAALPIWYDPTPSAVLRELPAVPNAELASMLKDDEERAPLLTAARAASAQSATLLSVQMDALYDKGLAVILLDAAANENHWLWAVEDGDER